MPSKVEIILSANLKVGGILYFFFELNKLRDKSQLVFLCHFGNFHTFNTLFWL